MILPPSVSKLVYAFACLLVLSILFANITLVILSFIPFLWVMTGLILKPPSDITVKRTISRGALHVGESLKVTLDITIGQGMGIVMISDILPRHFLLQEGNSFSVIWKGWGERKLQVSYIILCTSSGTYHLEVSKWQAHHCLYSHILKGISKNKEMVEVWPRKMELGDLKMTASVSKIPMPQGSLVKTGISTLDFQELRLYTYGDSFKDVNWKATARNIYRGSYWPIVNGYEKEGKKAVWIFMDTSNEMGYGSNLESVYESSVEAVCGLSDYYLKMNCQVALCSFGGEEIFIYPGTGKKQYHKIVSRLLKEREHKKVSPEKASQASFKKTNLKEAVAAHRAYYAGVKPLFIVVSRAGPRNMNTLTEGIMEITKHACHFHGRFQMMMVNILGYELSSEKPSEQLASELLFLRDRNLAEGLRKRMIWVDWNPKRVSFSKALLKQVVRG